MGNPKHRWTLEEENALRAGVDKYGTGKWRSILCDDEFAPFLIDRSNVDLKDKWRNLCGSASSKATSPQCSLDTETRPWYNHNFHEALSSVDNSYGHDVDTPRNYIENVDNNDVQDVEVDIVDEDVVRVLREVGYEEHEINVAVEQVEEQDELPIGGHVESPMTMNTEDSRDACLIDDTQEIIQKPMLQVVFKALKKLMLVLKTSVKKLMLKIQRSFKF